MQLLILSLFSLRKCTLNLFIKSNLKFLTLRARIFEKGLFAFLILLQNLFMRVFDNVIVAIASVRDILKGTLCRTLE